MVKGEIFFIFFKEIEYHHEEETVTRGEFVELSFKTQLEQLMTGVLVVEAV